MSRSTLVAANTSLKMLVLRAGWSSKGATETATEDGNDLVMARVGRFPGTELEDGRPRVWEVVTEKRYVVRPWEAMGELKEVLGRLALQSVRRWGALVLFEGARRLTRVA
ncbi:hypothetical protein F5876DRAFT_68481 [Lentinula aff. lateritia]|uniref:Uncharacterized protein n=1 Tax=Lentinula aff. lateritia TaxID=2804960 RepID=A0ACC1TQX2_9AGAR|nr:hypothetical protein F5876DRAFT_68481 [Lentinula aff. lateritia]